MGTRIKKGMKTREGEDMTLLSQLKIRKRTISENISYNYKVREDGVKRITYDQGQNPSGRRRRRRAGRRLGAALQPLPPARRRLHGRWRRGEGSTPGEGKAAASGCRRRQRAGRRPGAAPQPLPSASRRLRGRLWREEGSAAGEG
uniref:Hypothetical_protein n=1 Tax=Oryza glaberrima TaxID=4538 RepID=G2XMP0_ORYGL|nr:hypothetical_protein [Oryza glaberrima]